MTRPTCPHCQRLAVVANSHRFGEVRVKVFGCLKCRAYGLGKLVTAADVPRTRAVIGINLRDPSGRFASVR